MPSFLPPLLATVCSSLAACGAGQPQGAGAPRDEAPSSDSTSSDSTNGDSTSSDSTNDTTAEQTGDRDVMETCIEGGALALEALLLQPETGQARILGPRGAFVLKAPSPGGILGHRPVAANATRVFVVGSTPGPSSEAESVYAFSRTTGELEWQALVPGPIGQLFAGDDGSVVVWTSGPAGARIVEGQVQALDFSPSGGVHEGWLPVHRLDAHGLPIAFGWLAMDDLAFLEADPQPPMHANVRIDGKALEFIDAIEGATSLIRTEPGKSSSTPLSSLAALPVREVSLSAAAGPLRLLQGDDPQTGRTLFVRLDVATGERIDLDPVAPAGYDFFSCDRPQPVLDRSGKVLITLHDGRAARLFTYTPETDAWTPIGKPVTATHWLWANGGFGSVHVLSSMAKAYCQPVAWGDPAPRGALTGDTLQVVRIDPPLAIELPGNDYGRAAVDPHERCVAYPEGEGWTVRGLDDDATLSFGGGEWVWLDP